MYLFVCVVWCASNDPIECKAYTTARKPIGKESSNEEVAVCTAYKVCLSNNSPSINSVLTDTIPIRCREALQSFLHLCKWCILNEQKKENFNYCTAEEAKKQK